MLICDKCGNIVHQRKKIPEKTLVKKSSKVTVVTLEELTKRNIKESAMSRKSDLKINLSNKKLMKISSLDRTEDSKMDEIGV